MTKKASIIQKSLVEQILEQMFASIEKREEFDTNSIQKLKQLASAGELTKTKQVIEAIKGVTEGT
jgi:predicted transcriptional regulator